MTIFPDTGECVFFFQSGHPLKIWFQKCNFLLLCFGELTEVGVSVLCKYHMDGLVSGVKAGLCLGHRLQKQEWDCTPHYEPDQLDISE